jgi:hypothetical protein
VVLTAVLFLCCNTISGDTSRVSANPPAAEVKVPPTSEGSKIAEAAKPDSPTPKTTISAAAAAEPELVSGSDAVTPAIQPGLNTPVKPAIVDSYETATQRRIWYGLMVAGHGAAAFDAWTTRRAITSGYGVEGDPLQRPFANSGAIYATTQVTPVIMDYLGRRMLRSSHPLFRKTWWIPQAACATVSLGSGIHNYHVVP